MSYDEHDRYRRTPEDDARDRVLGADRHFEGLTRAAQAALKTAVSRTESRFSADAAEVRSVCVDVVTQLRKFRVEFDAFLAGYVAISEGDAKDAAMTRLAEGVTQVIELLKGALTPPKKKGDD
ncbi:MAG: hypothetical protein M0R66_03765 [Candidatus Omnitrophica bacterium]|nr:hypothetical protein [Candidatus Omnitrophota bacterium]